MLVGRAEHAGRLVAVFAQAESAGGLAQRTQQQQRLLRAGEVDDDVVVRQPAGLEVVVCAVGQLSQARPVGVDAPEVVVLRIALSPGKEDRFAVVVDDRVPHSSEWIVNQRGELAGPDVALLVYEVRAIFSTDLTGHGQHYSQSSARAARSQPSIKSSGGCEMSQAGSQLKSPGPLSQADAKAAKSGRLTILFPSKSARETLVAT